MKNVIQRELSDNLQSLQFLVLLIVSTALFAASGIISIKKYDKQNALYNRKVTETRQNPSTSATAVYDEPNPLTFMSDGGDKYRPPGYELAPKGKLTAEPSGPRNFKLPDIPELDWSFIIKIVFSLYVLLLGYHAISGEKEQGTLRQILSNSVGRMSLLIKKYVAIMLTVLIPLVVGFLISLIIVSQTIPHILSLENPFRMLLMLLLGLTYLSIFVFLSLLFSSLIHRSSLVLLVLLSCWILFAVIIPNVSGVLAQKFSDVPSEYQTAKQVGPMIQEQVWGRIDRIKERVKQGELKKEEEVKREADRAFEQGQDDLRKHYASYENAMRRRANVAGNLSRLSPTALFQFASESIANSGIKREEQFVRDVRAYSEIYDDYIRQKVGKVVGTSFWSFSTNVLINGKSVFIQSPQPEEYEGDKSDFPYFVESKPSIARSLRDALFDLAGLLLWNLVLAVLAFSAFLRCDVR